MKNDIPSRRGVLRGALALGCGVWVPLVLSGCDAKKSTSSDTSAPAPAPAATPSVSADVSASAAVPKVAKETVQYQTQPKGEQKCATCLHFIAASNTCQLVAGQISPDGWCILWAKKA